MNKGILLSGKEAAKALNVSNRTVYNMLDRGEIRKYVTNSGHVVFYISQETLDLYNNTYRIKSVCNLLGCSRGTLYKYIHLGLIQPIKRAEGLPVLFNKDDAQKFCTWLNTVNFDFEVACE